MPRSKSAESGAVKVILLSDGTKIKTMPDGSKIKVMPDGRKFKKKPPVSSSAPNSAKPEKLLHKPSHKESISFKEGGKDKEALTSESKEDGAGKVKGKPKDGSQPHKPSSNSATPEKTLPKPSHNDSISRKENGKRKKAPSSKSKEGGAVKVILLSDGTKIKTMSDGSKIKVMPDGRKFKMKPPTSSKAPKQNNSSHSSKPKDGSPPPKPSSNSARPEKPPHKPSHNDSISRKENGKREKAPSSKSKEGGAVKVILLSDGTKIKTMPNGSKIKVTPDGRKFKMKPPMSYSAPHTARPEKLMHTPSHKESISRKEDGNHTKAPKPEDMNYDNNDDDDDQVSSSSSTTPPSSTTTTSPSSSTSSPSSSSTLDDDDDDGDGDDDDDFYVTIKHTRSTKISTTKYNLPSPNDITRVSSDLGKDVRLALNPSRVDSEQYLRDNLLNAGLDFQEPRTPADGNCMFHALAAQIEMATGFQMSHQQFREQVMEYLRKHRHTPDGSLMEDWLLDRDWDAYLAEMSRDRVWGDEIVLMAVANMYKVKIMIISSLPGNSTRVLSPAMADLRNVQTLLLGHIAETHYYSLEHICMSS